jgi:hypothetical protein
MESYWTVTKWIRECFPLSFILEDAHDDSSGPSIFQEKTGQTFTERLWQDIITEARQYDAELPSLA